MNKLISLILFLTTIATYSQIKIKISPGGKYSGNSRYIKIDLCNNTDTYYVVPIDTLALRPFDYNYKWKDFDKADVVQSSLALTLYVKEKGDKDYLSAVFMPLHLDLHYLDEVEKQFTLEIQEKNKKLEEWKKSNKIESGIDIEKNLYLNNNMIILKPNETLTLHRKINHEFTQEVLKSYKMNFLYGIKGNTEYEIFVQLDAPKNLKNFLTKKNQIRITNYKIFEGRIRSNSIPYKTDPAEF